MTNDFEIRKEKYGDRLIPIVSATWGINDRIGAIKVRWALNRNDYRIEPGLYGVGKPDENSPVFVTGNYKLSFDHLRTTLSGMEAWILVLNTKGINVWCAAGKGTFGTDELVHQVSSTQLGRFVKHRKLILPQLGAPGIAAHIVKEKCGFQVIYGPVRAEDISSWMKHDSGKEAGFRKVRFNFFDRLLLTGVEISVSLWYLVFTMAAFFLIGGLNKHGYSIDLAFTRGVQSSICLLLAYLSGTLLAPALLPYIPFRAFSLKGAVMGLIIFFIGLASGHFHGSPTLLMAWLLLMTSVSSYLAMNFTGTSPITNLSGVLLEVKRSIPFQAGMAGVGIILFIISLFLN